MKVIVVNNPAAKEGGAFTILDQFLKRIYESKRKSIFYVFVSVEELKKYEKENIKIIVLPKQSFLQRILWDNFGLKKYLKQNGINPNLFISIQNTGVNLDKKIPQILYFHQSIPLSNVKWNLFKKNERIYWLYKNIYPIFIKQYLSRTKKVIVQTQWVKDAFIKKFNYPEDKIFVIKPKVQLPDIKKIIPKKKDKFRIFYPAAPFIYKNHKVIVEALGKLSKENSQLLNNIECIFTFLPQDNLEVYNLIKQYNLEEVIKLIGKISYNEVLEYYKSSDLMIFSSYIETLGLPLLEAKHFNLDIIAIDLPYSREVIGIYNKIEYFKKEDIRILKKNIEKKIGE